MSNGSILFVDDDYAMVDSITTWFRGKGYKATPAHHPLQGLIQAAHHKFDVAVIDVGSHEMDGFDLLDEFVRLELFPVIVLTGNGNPEFKVDAIGRGAVKVLVKPAEMEKIENAIDYALSQSRVFAATIHDWTSCEIGSLGAGHAQQ